MKTFLPDREELAWAGGFFSGEGCTILQRYNQKGHNKKPYPSVYASQVTVEELLRFQKALGGLGKIIGPIKVCNPLSKQPQYKINIYGFEKTQAAIALMWPFLSTKKKEQATKVLIEYLAWRS